MDKISIVLPCYNHGKYVAESINSVLNQTYQNFELFVYDNGSSDHSWEVIQSFNDPRMIKTQIPVNNALAVKKHFIEHSTGKYCAIMFSDDLWLPEKLERQMNFLSEHPEARLCFTWSRLVDEEFVPIDNLDSFYKQPNQNTQKEWWQAFLTTANHLPLPSFLCEKEIYVKYFSVVHPYRQAADFYTWMQILQETNFYVLEEVLVNQRVHNRDKNKNESYRSDENLSREKRELPFLIFKIFNEMSDEVFLRFFCSEKDTLENNSHLDVLCKKYLFFAREYPRLGCGTFYENALRFYDMYYNYVEDGHIFYQYLDEKYGYSRLDYFELMGATTQNRDRTIRVLESRIKRWYRLENTDFSTIDYPEKITIFGLGYIGRAFYRKVKEYCRVEQFMDSHPPYYTYDGIPVRTMKEAVIDESTIVVITPSYDFDQICKEFTSTHRFVNTKKLIPLEKFLDTGDIIDQQYQER